MTLWLPKSVSPAKAGVQVKPTNLSGCIWAPAFAGVIGV
jgi:hypothetical protein